MARKPLPDLLCLAYRARVPEFLAPPRRAGGGAIVCGGVRIGSGAQLGASVVIRGDGHDVAIGDDFLAGERSTIHVAHDELPTVIGNGVTVGANCALRACRVGDRCVLENDVVVLDGAEVGAGCALERNSLVAAGARLPAGHYCRGNPASAVRPLEPGELQLLRGRVRNAPARAEAPRAAPRAERPWAGFVALTAQVEGALELESDASIWFGARLDGGHHGIRIGAGSNVQDNCVAYAMSSPLRIGTGVTVGHNVTLQDCRIGDDCLVGMSCLVAAGTVIEDDVMLAAGSVTLPRQQLQAGWLWGGRPARAIAPMNAERRGVVERHARVYRDYLQGFRQAIAEYSATED